MRGLRAELIKLGHRPATWVISGIALASLVLVIYLVLYIAARGPGGDVPPEEASVLSQRLYPARFLDSVLSKHEPVVPRARHCSCTAKEVLGALPGINATALLRAVSTNPNLVMVQEIKGTQAASVVALYILAMGFVAMWLAHRRDVT